MPHVFDPSILREYDIRGVVGTTLNVTDATALGRVFGTYALRAGAKHVMVGYDGRIHSKELENAVVAGLVSTGLRVTRIGLGPTPMLYFAVHYANAGAGLMVTGSHNAPDQNGFKMVLAKHLKGGGPVFGDALRLLAAMAANGDMLRGNGEQTNVDVRAMYIDRLMKDFECPRHISVVWDLGNGAAGDIAMRLKAKLSGHHTMLFTDVDGRFPNHPPDPSLEQNLTSLRAEVRKRSADLGVALDGDGDRMIAVDGQGRMVMGDQLLALFAEPILKLHKGATIIADVKSSAAFFERVTALGGKALMWKTGHSLIKAKMVEMKSPLAGEMSGHIFFADKYYGFDDGLYAALRLISLLSASGKSLAAHRDRLLQTQSTPEIRLKVDRQKKATVIEDVLKRLVARKAKIITIDGVRVETKDGWWLLRASNTEDLLIGRAESPSADGLQRLKSELAEQLELSGVSLPAI